MVAVAVNKSEKRVARKLWGFPAAVCCLGVVLMLSVAAPAAVGAEDLLNRYLHPNASLGDGPPEDAVRPAGREPITPRQACSYAALELIARMVDDISICEVRWIAAPLSGYLVDARGRASIRGNVFSVFRIGIRDGLEEQGGKRAAGDVFVFIAYGKGVDDIDVWHPSPGPDPKPGQGKASTTSKLAYEFLPDREQFQTLLERYPKVELNDSAGTPLSSPSGGDQKPEAENSKPGTESRKP